MLKVGITGGIGSGKTTVCKIFEVLGIPVYYADDRAKAIMVENKDLIQKLKGTFGQETYFNDGTLNRAHLSNIVFEDADKLKQLNSIVHPAVGMDTMQWMQQHSDKAYVLYEAAILFEMGSNKWLDKTITVFADKDLRIERTMQRDQCTKEAVEARMDKQMNDEEKKKLADYIITNNVNDALIPQVIHLHRELLNDNKS